ncbi:hypothetical protein ACFL0L_05445 [Patescibacteria group bacterium]
MPQKSQQPQDIYQNVEDAPRQAAPAPRRPNPRRVPTKQSRPTQPTVPKASSGSPGQFPVLLIVVLFLVIVGLVVVIFFNPFQKEVTNDVVDVAVNEEPTILPTTITPPTANTDITDTDGDGLTDTEEQQAGTSSTSVDSDADGLYDREEVKVYSSNPLKADTDGDGVSDSDEVTQGTDPAGPGLLRDLQSEIEKLGQ